MLLKICKYLLFLIPVGLIICQTYYPADPADLLLVEKNLIDRSYTPSTLMIRPLFSSDDAFQGKWQLKLRTEQYYNSNAPNLENTSDKWIGRGISSFNSFNISYYGKYFVGSVEPFYFINQNSDFYHPDRTIRYSHLNDNPAHSDKPYQILNVREAQLYLHYKGIGMGYSNANMWWGSGIHSSLMMTNNTTGFGHFSFGTLKEKKIGNVGINARYLFTKFDKKNKYEPFYNALALSFTYYSDPIITLGLTKAALNGGTYPGSDDVSWKQAPFLIFDGIFFAPKDIQKYFENWSTDDHTIAAYFETYFAKSKLKIFLEVGRNDIAWDKFNLILAPDHTIATLFGMRKYGMLNIQELFFGMEYMKQYYGKYDDRLLVTPWYKPRFDYASYNGRDWGPHSGHDSDDFLIYAGWMKDKIYLTTSFNYERHGVQVPDNSKINESTGSQQFGRAETKYELRFDIRYKFDKFSIYFLLEREILKNFEFTDKTRKGTVFMVGIERYLKGKAIY